MVAHAELAAARPQEAKPHVVHGRAPVDAESVEVASIEDRVRPRDGVGEIENIAHPKVFQEEHGREPPVVDLRLELAFPLDHFHLRGVETVQPLLAAPHPHPVEGEGLVGRLELQGDLRRALEAGVVDDLASVAPEDLARGSGHPDLPVAQEVVGAAAQLVLRRIRGYGDLERLHPGGSGGDAIAATSGSRRRHGQHGGGGQPQADQTRPDRSRSRAHR